MKKSVLEQRLRKHAEITKSVMQPPFGLNEEIKNMEVHTMSKPKTNMKRTLALVAVLALCVITVTITPFANSIRGFFDDIIGFDGAITGTQYNNATNDIMVNVMEPASDNGNTVIPLELTFKNPNVAPFAYIQEIAVADYMVIDSTTGEILKLKSYPEYSGKGNINNGSAVVKLSLNDANFKSGEEYTIVIEKMYGLAKADAPLHIIGKWECKFVK